MKLSYASLRTTARQKLYQPKLMDKEFTTEGEVNAGKINNSHRIGNDLPYISFGATFLDGQDAQPVLSTRTTSKKGM